MSAPPDNVVPLRARPAHLSYAPGVTPFDPSNPDHVSVWNTLHKFGWSEQRFRDRERMERSTSLDVMK